MHENAVGRPVPPLAAICLSHRLCISHRGTPDMGMISPYEIQYGAPARNTFSKILTVSSQKQLQQLLTDDGDMENARLFALAIKTSATIGFYQIGEKSRSVR
jgi:hypothetical protein